eukprot:CAMPEP_0115120396 /NCGR_PEP_ID=MMETSP0227-20121206/45663_1 /TAXON_ID=89957 /ORGANISM="Polarella glacialis, Strain CCMP 1383" /LENGTH=86 /DNA_ID=CAMNT_0002522051 /DNA_START=37 /DNA_END=294 /DNA_ORIENTATION=-
MVEATFPVSPPLCWISSYLPIDKHHARVHQLRQISHVLPPAITQDQRPTPHHLFQAHLARVQVLADEMKLIQKLFSQPIMVVHQKP